MLCLLGSGRLLSVRVRLLLDSLAVQIGIIGIVERKSGWAGLLVVRCAYAGLMPYLNLQTSAAAGGRTCCGQIWDDNMRVEYGYGWTWGLWKNEEQ